MRDRKRTGRKGRRMKAVDYSAEEIEKAAVLLHERLPTGANYKTIMDKSNAVMNAIDHRRGKMPGATDNIEVITLLQLRSQGGA
eukprot:1333954-Heterocapsa_arctica.AAC.1